MKKFAIATALTLALAASPALGQGRSGGGGGGGGPPAGGPGGGMGGGMGDMGRGPPMSVPGQTADARSSARDIAGQRGQFGRDFAEQQRAQADLLRERASEFQARSAERKLEALARRDAARAGQPINMSSQEIRGQLKADMEQWRETFQVGRQDWQKIRDELLVDAGTLTPEQWAARRAQWFEIRDQWIARQVEHAKSRAGSGG